MRETLFNWLGPGIEGARCLDVFAGAGSLGVEALSRGASDVVFVEHAKAAAAAIEANLDRLGAAGGEVVAGDARDYLAGATKQFDIVFLDPPFDAGLLETALNAGSSLLEPNGCLYLEYRESAGAPALPDGFKLMKSSRAGQVGFALTGRM